MNVEEQHRYVRIEPPSELHTAIQAGDLSAVDRLIAAGVDANEWVRYAWPYNDLEQPDCWPSSMPLMAVAYARIDSRTKAQIARVLIEQGNANVRGPFPSGLTPLHFAANNGDVELTDLLIQHGAGVDVLLDGEETPLHWALHWRQPSTRAAQRDRVDRTLAIVSLLLDAGADPNARGEYSFCISPLWLAVGRHPDIVRLLLERGADPSAAAAENGSSELLIHTVTLASRIDDLAQADAALEAIPLLAAAGADLNDVETRLLHYAAGSWPVTAEEAKRIAIVVQALAAAGADVNLVDSATGETALFRAVIGGNPYCVKTLIDLGADARHLNKEKVSTWANACREMNEDIQGIVAPRAEIRRLLEEAGATQPPDEVRTCLHAAIRWELTRDVLRLLDSGADPNYRDEVGDLPLHIAIRCVSPIELIRALLDYGAVVDERGIHGVTALMMAATTNDTETAEMLLSAGADVDAVDGEERTALMYAGDCPEVLSLLLERGADISRRDRFGRNALYCAAKARCRESRDILLVAGADVTTSVLENANGL